MNTHYPLDGDVKHKKEFVQRAIKNKDDELLSETSKKGIVVLMNYQRFVRDFMRLQTPYEYLLVVHPTGSGKTITSLSLAKTIVDYAKIQHAKEYHTTQKIFILGFTEQAYVKTLVTKPYFGFVTEEEAEELAKATNYNHYKELFIRYRKRLKYSKYGGVFQFYGYKKLVNRLLKDTDELKELQEITDDMVNKEFYEQFENSIIICDEIHNVYNSRETNNYGIALNYILNHVKNKKVMFLSWTPLTNKATEIYDLLHLLNGKALSSFNHTNEITKRDLELLTKAFTGKISYLNKITEGYPELIYEGAKLGKISPYKFLISKMSPEHAKFAKTSSDTYVNDFCFPMPKTINNPLGLGSNKEDIQRLKLLKEPERKKLGIVIEKDTINGSFIKDLKKYSMKYWTMIQLILKILRSPNINGKIFIYHRYIAMSGVLFIGNVLKYYGFTALNDAVSRNAIDVNGKTKSKGFIPAKFVLIHSDMKKEDINKYIDLYNSPDNAFGDKIKIIVGGNIMRESYDMKAINHIIITHRPDNFKTADQIIGRGARKNSHILVKNKTVRVYILVNKDSDEASQYKKKYKDLVEINRVEQFIFKGAIDRNITWGTNKVDIDTSHYTTDTFKIYNKQEEIDETVIVIKRLFMLDKTWRYKTLWKSVKDPPFTTYAPLVSEASFILALDYLIFDNEFIHTVKDETRQVFSSIDKRINIEGVYHVIQSIGEYYIAFPYDKKQRDAIIDYGITSIPVHKRININTYVKKREDTYDLKDRIRLLSKAWSTVDIVHWSKFMCQYSVDFYGQLIEEVIKYTFNLWIKKIPKSEYHLFYFKILYYFASMDLVVFANKANNLKHLYQDNISSPYEIKNIYNIKECDTCDTINIGKYQSIIASAKVAIRGRCPRVPGNLLPVGHFLLQTPRFYTIEDNWFESRDFTISKKKKENDVIIGFYIREQSQLLFKIREPIHKQPKNVDKRKQAKGVNCSSIPKHKLLEILKKLGIEVKQDKFVDDLCNILKIRLIDLEQSSDMRYFYQFFEDKGVPPL